MPKKKKSVKRRTAKRTTKRTTKKRKARFELKDLLGIGLALVVFGIGISYGLEVSEDVQDDFVTDTANCNSTHTTACGADYNASADAITGISKLPEKTPLIATVIIAAVVIGILVRYLFVRFV